MARPCPIDDAVLKRGIAHVCYEYANLISAAYWSIHGEAPWRTHADDAFLLGYRKLADFLLKDKRPRRNGVELPDLRAKDYLPADTTRTWVLPTWTSEWQVAMDKQLAHITFERDEEWVHWRWVPPLEEEMKLAWAQFLRSVDPQYKSEFAAQLSKCLARPGFTSLKL